MTLDEIKKNSMVAGMEGLGGYHWEFDDNKFAKLLINEIVSWSRDVLGMSENDEEALREHLGL